MREDLWHEIAFFFHLRNDFMDIDIIQFSTKPQHKTRVFVNRYSIASFSVWIVKKNKLIDGAIPIQCFASGRNKTCALPCLLFFSIQDILINRCHNDYFCVLRAISPQTTKIQHFSNVHKKKSARLMISRL